MVVGGGGLAGEVRCGCGLVDLAGEGSVALVVEVDLVRRSHVLNSHMCRTSQPVQIAVMCRKI